MLSLAIFTSSVRIGIHRLGACTASKKSELLTSGYVPLADHQKCVRRFLIAQVQETCGSCYNVRTRHAYDQTVSYSTIWSGRPDLPDEKIRRY
jgi:hypothetical protein